VTDTLHIDDELLSACLDGELTEAEQRVVDDHQRRCTVCQGRADALRAVAALVGWAVVVPAEAPLTAPPLDLSALDTLVAGTREDWPAVGGGRAPGRGRPSRRRGGWVAMAAATAAAVGIAFAAIGRPAHHVVPVATVAGAGSTGPHSLGSFSGTATLRATLRAEINSRGSSGSGPVLPCHNRAAAGAGQPAGAEAVFSARLTYAGAPAQVFAYRTTGPNGDLAVVEQDRYCILVARFGW
jgi:hypothetical protein